MTREEKQLLLKDLCARLPYVTYYDLSYYGHKTRAIIQEFIAGNESLKSLVKVNTIVGPIPFENIKPYLRPMSSMTGKEREEFYKECEKDYKIAVNEANRSYKSKFDEYAPLLSSYHKHDWLNANHVDYRGLIPMGLALEAPKDMYK